jgi:queuine tRNA-ribosyltransferase
MAAINCYEQAAKKGPVRPMRIISFENDLDSLRLALRNHDKFLYLRHGAPPALLQDGKWQSKTHPGLSWEVVYGDFFEAINLAPARPDLVFYDMFSSKSAGDQWTCDAFRRIFEACQGRPAELFTYTCSTAIRAALLAAGFYVAKGRSTGEKLETTVALTPEAAYSATTGRHELLCSLWLQKWNRSGAKFPAELELDEHPHFERVILTHAQFQRS